MNLSDLPKGVTVYAVVNVQEMKQISVHDRQAVYCYRCGELGHRKSECMHWKTRICSHYRDGTCIRDVCPFAHGVKELRCPNFVNPRTNAGWVGRDASVSEW